MDVEIRVLFIPEVGEMEVITVNRDCGEIQKWVGGYVQAIRQNCYSLDCVILVDEEGKCKNNVINNRASNFYGYSILVGNVMLVAEGPVDGGFDFISLSDKTLDLFMKVNNLKTLKGFIENEVPSEEEKIFKVEGRATNEEVHPFSKFGGVNKKNRNKRGNK